MTPLPEFWKLVRPNRRLVYNILMIRLVTDVTRTIDISPVEGIIANLKTNPMAGWLSVPADPDEISRIKAAAEKINSDSEVLVCIGIGGSYLGHRAVIEALGNRSNLTILYAGNNLSSYEIETLFAEIGDRDFSINVISKSGTTLEPAVSFRIFKEKLIQKYGAAYNKRIYATTDAEKGALHDEAVKNDYERFVVPGNIGGRFSVLTAVGLLPIAVAGIDIDELLDGARTVALEGNNFTQVANPVVVGTSQTGSVLREAARYALIRQAFYADGHETEILASFEPRLFFFQEWWKQLFGESEGKEGKGIFPASVSYTTDLHSLGQYLQQGRRNIFETVVKITTSGGKIAVPASQDNSDGLAYLQGKSLDEINGKALEATVVAHRTGGIPVLLIELSDLSARTMGELIYFFEISCAISATMSGVNPFDQPGVEAYKQNMFSLLGKPQA